MSRSLGARPLTRRQFSSGLMTLIASGGILATTVACGDASGGRNRDTATTVSGVTEIEVRDDYFSHPSVAIPPGTTVTWVWRGQHPHNVIGGPLESTTQTTGEYQFTFDTPGTVNYECTLHPGMTGEVIVGE